MWETDTLTRTKTMVETEYMTGTKTVWESVVVPATATVTAGVGPEIGGGGMGVGDWMGVLLLMVVLGSMVSGVAVRVCGCGEYGMKWLEGLVEMVWIEGERVARQVAERFAEVGGKRVEEGEDGVIVEKEEEGMLGDLWQEKDMKAKGRRESVSTDTGEDAVMVLTPSASEDESEK